MGKWKVTMKKTVTFEAVVEVEAENEIDAGDKAEYLDYIEWGAAIDSDEDVVDVEEIKQ